MKSNQEIYQAHLEHFPSVLRETALILQTIIINLAMSGELSELNNQLEYGDAVTFKYKDFRSLSDYNVQLAYEIFDFLKLKIDEVNNVNGLDSEDDEEYPF